MNNSKSQIILLIKESDATRDFADASVVIVLGEGFTSLLSVSLK